ncbi:putative zinc finger protein [Tripterygium wilfordii]|uniref:Putative zinc finger protein n=1 Tax=Tripterygium wilfordii TaxID=458696 RepID=A0A7J7CT71_TRIWF|nr:putative zinc finger protein [Tripterygium wilfordii]
MSFQLMTKSARKGSGTLEIKHMHEIHHWDAIVDNFSDVFDRDDEDEVHEFGQAGMEQIPLPDADPILNSSARGGGRRGWFFLAAAPIVSIVGIALVLWLRNPLDEGTRARVCCNISEQLQHQIHIAGTSMPDQRGGRRRWWSLF